MSIFTVEADGTIGQDSYKQGLLETRSKRMVAIVILTMGLLTMSAGLSPESARAHHISATGGKTCGQIYHQTYGVYQVGGSVSIVASGDTPIYWAYALEAYTWDGVVRASDFYYGGWPSMPGAFSRWITVDESAIGDVADYYRVSFWVWDGHGSWIYAPTTPDWCGPI